MPRPIRPGNWKKDHFTLSEAMRKAIVEHAMWWNLEKGAAADRLLRMGVATHQGLQEPGIEEPTNRVALWRFLNQQFLDEAMDLMERNSFVEEFAGVLGQEIAESRSMKREPLEWVGLGALEIVNWLRQGRVSPRWKRRVYDHLDSVWTFHPLVLNAGITLDQFLEEG